MNVSATLNAFRVLFNPALILPQSTIANFNQLPIPVHKAFPKNEEGEYPDIRAVVLDKDNCFAVPKENVVYKDYEEHFSLLRRTYPETLLIVSNSSGTTQSDPTLSSAALLTRNTSVPVLSHSVKKPGCKAEIMAYFASRPETGVTHPSQIAVVGDRLTTDVLMANMMGAHAVWVKDGVVRPSGVEGFFVGLEKRYGDWARRRGYSAPVVGCGFEGE